MPVNIFEESMLKIRDWANALALPEFRPTGGHGLKVVESDNEEKPPQH